MTLSEAIKHCEERIDCSECGKEHKQLAEWLGKLKHCEDLEAQGRLIEMPCYVGDIMYTNYSMQGWYMHRKIDHMKQRLCLLELMELIIL